MPQVDLPIGLNGPILTLYVWASSARRSALVAAGQATPLPLQARFLVDTGASTTVVDPSIISRLALSPTGSISAHTPSTTEAPVQAFQYDVSIIVPTGSAQMHPFDPVAVCAMHVKQQGIDGLLGRDVLSEGMLVYSGPSDLCIISV